ncbi:MAG: hypothetical protein ACJAXY_001110 [Nonlabens sp.]|jgi:hypothetical protein
MQEFTDQFFDVVLNLDDTWKVDLMKVVQF